MIEVPETIVSVSKSEESVLGIQSMGMLEKYRDGTVRRVEAAFTLSYRLLTSSVGQGGRGGCL